MIFGNLEYKVLSDFCKYHRLRRKKTLIQTRINRKEEINYQILKPCVEVRKLDIIDEEIADQSMINSTLSFNRNYNIGKFFKKLKSDYHLNSVKLNKEKDKD